jgi:hypothetical protein
MNHNLLHFHTPRWPLESRCPVLPAGSADLPEAVLFSGV